MNLAKVTQGRVVEHFEGDQNLISYKEADKESVVEFPEWAKVIREENLRTKMASVILVWDYANKNFKKIDEPHYEMIQIIILFKVRAIRNAILAATDFVASASDASFSTEQRNEVLVYRQTLRDLPELNILADFNTLEAFYKTNNFLPDPKDHFPTPPAFIATAVGIAYKQGDDVPLDQDAISTALSHLNLIGIR